MPKYSLKTHITLVVALFSVVLVTLISVFSRAVVNQQFVQYITRQHQSKTDELLSSLSAQYSLEGARWDLDFIHIIGMYALYDGYIIAVNDLDGVGIWDAQTHDMSMCYQVMNDIQRRMEQKYPSVDGEFTVASYPLEQNGQRVGTVDISYYGPYFLSENDFDFLNALNTVLIAVALAALAVSLPLGWLVASRISRPILRAVEAVGHMGDGDYAVRLDSGNRIAELERLTVSVNRLAGALETQECLRRRLTADVAHELRTPLTAIGTHLEAMTEGVWEPTPARLQRCCEETLRLGKLVSDLEGLAHAESDTVKLDKRPVRCLDCVEQVLEAFALEIEHKELVVETTGEHTLAVQADRDRLQQVLGNLVSNAVKYTPAGGRIRISAERDGRFGEIRVEDNGIGIPQQDLPHVFERFYRVDQARTRTSGGAGIGLAVAKALVRLHGGEITAESEPEKGSVFCVRLPV